VVLPLLLQGKRIINIDESWIPYLDFRKEKWAPRGQKNTMSSKDLSTKVNMLIALDTSGRVYAALTQVNTDSDVMVSFLSRLAAVLTKQDRDWRSNSVLLLDGAKYHTSLPTRVVLKRIGADYIISAPYSYDAAPVELFFAYMKQVQINESNEKTGRR